MQQHGQYDRFRSAWVRMLATVALPVLLSLLPGTGRSQSDTVLSGFVLELESGEPMEHVAIKNLVTGALTESGPDGRFSIAVRKNERLQFAYPGYRTDTLVVVEFETKRVYLTSDGSAIQLDEVLIQTMTDSRLAVEIKRAREEGRYAEASQQRGGIRISPSKLLSQEARLARQRYELLLAEQQRRKIDTRFTRELVMTLTPLHGEDLDLYMARYRPTVELIEKTDEAGLRLYVMDTYAQFKTLTAEQLDSIRISGKRHP